MVTPRTALARRWHAAGLDLDALRGIAVRVYDCAHELHLDRSCGRLRSQSIEGYRHETSYTLLSLPHPRCRHCCRDDDVLARTQLRGLPLVSWLRRAVRVRQLGDALAATHTDPARLALAAAALRELTEQHQGLGPAFRDGLVAATAALQDRERLLELDALVALGRARRMEPDLAPGLAPSATALVVARPRTGNELHPHHLDPADPDAPGLGALAAWLLPRPTVRWLPGVAVEVLAAAAGRVGWELCVQPCPEPAGVLVAQHLLAEGTEARLALQLAAATAA